MGRERAALSDHAVVTYRYGIPSWVECPPLMVRQLRLGHEFGNHLVELHRAHEAAVADLWRTRPDIAAAERAVLAAEEAAVALAARAKTEHVRDRSSVHRSTTRADLAAARKAVRDARQAHKAAKADAYAALEPSFARAKVEHRAKVKAARQDFASRGLYWGNYNAVLASHQAAVTRVAAQRRAGQPAELRFRRWTGEGTVTVQLQREAGAPQRTPELLASGGGQWRNVLQLAPWVDPGQFDALSRSQRRQAGRGLVTLAVGDGQQITLPVVVHRMLPAEADVTMARLTRRRVAGNWRMWITVVAKVPAARPVDQGPAVAVHVGWRVRPDRSLRVATWQSTVPLTPPPHLAGIVASRGTWGEVLLPASWRDQVDRLEGVRSVRDKALDRMRGDLAAWLDDHPLGGDEPTGGDVRRWKSPARFAALAIRWRDDPPPHGTDMAVDLEAWRRQDRHLWSWAAHGRDQLIAARRDAWRKVAAWLSANAATVVVDDSDIRDLAARPEEGDDDQARRARANRVIAAPGELRGLVAATAKRDGRTVHVMPAAGITRTHLPCGHVIDRSDEFAEQVVVWCPTCERGYDQDRNACEWLLAASGQAPPPDPVSARTPNTPGGAPRGRHDRAEVDSAGGVKS